MEKRVLHLLTKRLRRSHNHKLVPLNQSTKNEAHPHPPAVLLNHRVRLKRRLRLEKAARVRAVDHQPRKRLQEFRRPRGRDLHRQREHAHHRRRGSHRRAPHRQRECDPLRQRGHRCGNAEDRIEIPDHRDDRTRSGMRAPVPLVAASRLRGGTESGTAGTGGVPPAGRRNGWKREAEIRASLQD